MKRCPECSRDYYDDTLLYCLDDGNALLEGPASGGSKSTPLGRKIVSEAATTDIFPPEIFPDNIAPTAVMGNASAQAKRDQLLIIDFENLTGDKIFDNTLKTALTFSLGQSPFLDIVPDAKVTRTLRLMKRAADEPVTRELAEEICLRLKLKAFLAGSISNLGSVYFLTLEAVNARTDESLGREYEQANSKEEILPALGRMATGIRERLGEKLYSIQNYDMPFDLTTSSFEALKFFTYGVEQLNCGKNLEAIPFLRKALEFDAGFAVAYTGLAAAYANTNQWISAKENAAKAFRLKDSVGEQERFRISYSYYAIGTGEIDKAVSTLELWRKAYSANITPVGNLASCYSRLGKYDWAVSVCREGLSSTDVAPAFLYFNLALSLLRLGRFEEVKKTCREALERNFDAPYLHLLLFQVGFVEQEAKLMADQLHWFSGRTDEYLALDFQARAAAFRGKWRTAQDFSRRAVGLAVRTNALEVAASFAAEEALKTVLWSAGTGLPNGDESKFKKLLKNRTDVALNLGRGNEVLSQVALALAFGGQMAEADSLMNDLHNESPKDTVLNEIWLPTIRAAILLQNTEAAEAVKELELTQRMERAAEFYPQYLRALALLQLDETKAAEEEFEKILSSRGEAPLSFLYPLAQLGKARATKTHAEYEKFFELWNEADPDMPALLAASNEFKSLI